jgi:hypothetical protein
MKIAVDLDDTTFDFMGAFAELYGPPVDPTKLTVEAQYPFLDPAVIHECFLNDEVYWRSLPIKDASWVLRKLAPTQDIWYVTARPKVLENLTRLILELYEFPFAGQLVLMEKLETRQASKIEYLRRNSFDIVIDDTPQTIRGVQEFVAFPYIFSRPWNMDFLWGWRINGWKEFYERFL